MIILRQPPFPLVATYDGLDPDTQYVVEVSGSHAELLFSEILSTDALGNLNILFYRFPEDNLDVWDFTRYDGTYTLQVTKFLLGRFQQPVIIDNLDIVRPYVNPVAISETPLEVEENKYAERLARFIIDSYAGGFYYVRDVVEVVGLGADFLPIPARITRIDKVTENNIVVYDRVNPVGQNQTERHYVVSNDYSAITIAVSGEFNYREARPARVPLAYSDSYALFEDNNDSPPVSTYAYNNNSLFPNGFFYVIEGEFGYPYIPTDIQDATRVLMNDILTRRDAYSNRYVLSYDTDQFTIKHDPSFVHGTGNRIADQILNKYVLPIYKLGVL
jgi:hypothetical protein